MTQKVVMFCEIKADLAQPWAPNIIIGNPGTSGK